MKVQVNNSITYQFETDHDKIVVDHQNVEIDYRKMKGGHAHFIYNHVSYNTEIISLDKLEKTVSVKVNGNVYNVSIADKYDLLLKQMGLDTLQGNRIQEVKAPMPGLVLKVLVAPGDIVAKGDSLLVLEAMKMENMIKSPTAGTVKNIFISTGDKVEKNEILIQFE